MGAFLMGKHLGRGVMKSAASRVLCSIGTIKTAVVTTQRLAYKASFGRNLLAAAITIAAVAGPPVFGLVNSPQARAQSPQTTDVSLPSFEVASIKPDPSKLPGTH